MSSTDLILWRSFYKKNNSVKHETAELKKLAEYQESKIDEMKAKLTSQFRKFINSISAQESKANNYHRVIGGKLIRLLDEFCKSLKPNNLQSELVEIL